ncbi:MAG: 4-vinyl reductase [Candidatus Diapherotrites archaeon]|nr:4-vinyl reductase [Candidatus Diapherotrites archaeon]
MINTFYDKFIFTGTLHYRHNNFYLLNIPFVMAPTEILRGISSITDIETSKRIYEAIKQSTQEQLVQQFSFNFGLEKKKELELIKEYFDASGWGAVQIIDADEQAKRAIIVVENSPIAQELKGKTVTHADVILRGIFAGAFSKIFEEKIDCVEVECAALNSERCKFIIKPKTEFDFTNKLVQEQINP